MSSRIEIKIPSQMDYLGIPDVILMEIGSDLECNQRGLEELGTSVIEACTNAMEHGNKLDKATPIDVIFDVGDMEITVSILDSGPGFDFSNWEPSPELMRERGRGILIMREFTDKISFSRGEDGRFMVILHKKLEPSDEDD